MDDAYVYRRLPVIDSVRSTGDSVGTGKHFMDPYVYRCIQSFPILIECPALSCTTCDWKTFLLRKLGKRPWGGRVHLLRRTLVGKGEEAQAGAFFLGFRCEALEDKACKGLETEVWGRKNSCLLNFDCFSRLSQLLDDFHRPTPMH
eukprot:jgi/Botrbrau1/22706/Bobra.0132s0045.1